MVVIGIVMGAALLYRTAARQGQGAEQTDPAAEGYGVGFFLGEDVRSGLRRDGVVVDQDLMVKGFRDGLGDKTPLMPGREIDEILAAVHAEMEARMVRRLLDQSPEFRRLYDDNLARSRAFHDLFGKQPGVVTLPSGAQYKVLRPGGGRSPGPADTVVLNARTTLLDGTVITDGQGLEVRVDTVIRGGAELLQRMQVGAKWQFAIPPELAHGGGGRFPDIGPNETIVGVAELLAIR